MKMTRKESTRRRHARVRKDVTGTTERPRLAVYRSNQHIYAQVIDDTNHHTMVSASTLEAELRKVLDSANNCDASAQVGKLLAERRSPRALSEWCSIEGGTSTMVESKLWQMRHVKAD